MGSGLGVADEKLLAIPDYETSSLFNDRERAALAYADSMTITGQEVPDEVFERVRGYFSDDELVELTEWIAWENASSKFNRAMRVPSQNLWKRR